MWEKCNYNEEPALKQLYDLVGYSNDKDDKDDENYYNVKDEIIKTLPDTNAQWSYSYITTAI